MKKIFALALFSVALNVQAAATVGQEAPDFKLTDSNGKEHSLKSFRGKTVVLEWLNHECPYVVKHYGANNMQQLQKTYTSKGVVWLSINSSAEGKQGHVNGTQANELTKEKGAAPTAVLLDPEGVVGKSYGAKTTPHMFVIDKKGLVVYNGAIDDKPSTNPKDIPGAKNYVAAALDSVLASKPVELATSKPYGCSVKYK